MGSIEIGKLENRLKSAAKLTPENNAVVASGTATLGETLSDIIIKLYQNVDVFSQ